MTRLTDLTVVEVSLVDKAANRRKFLLFKAEKNMADYAEIIKAVAALGEKVDSLLAQSGQRVEVPKDADGEALIKAMSDFGDRIAAAFQKVADQAATTADEVKALTDERDALKAQVETLTSDLEVAKNSVPDEVVEELVALRELIPTGEDIELLTEAAVAKVTGKAS